MEIVEVQVDANQPKKWDIRDDHGHTIGVAIEKELVDILNEKIDQDRYVGDCLHTESPVTEVNVNPRLLHAAMGIVTEAGELLDQLKKHLFYGKQLDRQNLIEELGDLYWYQSLFLSLLGVKEVEVKRANIRKLRARYPEKFTQTDALNRNLAMEMKSLAGENEC